MSDALMDIAQRTPGEIDGDPSELEPPAEVHPPRNLRQRAVRGVVVNTGFQIGFAGLGLLQRVLVAAFLTRSEFGLWGVLVATLITLGWLKQLGIGDKYIQQTEPDQEAAFQKAFTLELIVSLLFFALIVVVLPLYAIAYGHPEILVPGIVLATAVPISAFETPIWIPYRRMDYVRQRTLGAVDPVVAFAVTVILGVLGAGYWCLVIGAVAGSIAGGTVATLTCPYKLRLRFDRATVKEYASFSWPLFSLGICNLLVVQGTLLVANGTVGLAGLGAIGLAASIATFADRVNNIINQSIYPAVCRVTERVDVLHETFIKSNRVILMWAIPFGVGLALFASDFVQFVLGERWESSVNLMIGIGLIAAFNQIAFNWTVFMRAVNNTKPMLISSVIGVGVFAVVMVPVLLTLGLTGYVLGFAIATVVQIAVRCYFLGRLFPGFQTLRHLGRAIAPSVPAAGLILLARVAMSADRTVSLALAELVLYIAATVGFTLLFERSLIREILGYLRRRATPQAPVVAAVGASQG
jgi:O-antigen/teichoic acid export membrane protein